MLPGSFAELLVIDGDPLADLGVLSRPEWVPMIMKGGHIFHDLT